ncbi:hypothetical protein FOZ60_009745 [Perkinsus olseni]|uniref:ABC transporter domain-containing protein n=1 Tax=Perkinsus olseni TaxID=32597 RepID=A0A7J6NGK8_PEROL|nr:hypothetical protein FOZ60_009745 [Perkinsus olseni]
MSTSDNQVNAPSRISLEYSNMKYEVPIEGNPRKILNDLSGTIESGRLTAIMGPSGSGKSTFLNVLSGRTSSKSVKGSTVSVNLKVNGRGIDPMAAKREFAYVMSEDALLATSTPYECISFAAKMRLPRMKNQERVAKVDHLIDTLGLTKCQSSLIGNENIKGVSSGERKRTAVAVELVHDPPIMFLDEPTSGLDSFSAYKLVEVLKELNANGRCIVATIHQPSSEVFHLFDDVLFLWEGYCIYHGPVDEVEDYFARLGHSVPESFNPADFILFLTQTLDSEELQMMAAKWSERESASLMEPKVFCKGDHHDIPSSERSSFLDDIVVKVSDKRKEAREILTCSIEVFDGDFTDRVDVQFVSLWKRDVKGFFRDTNSLRARLAFTVFLNLLFGFIYLDSGGRSSGYVLGVGESVGKSHVGALTLLAINNMFSQAQVLLLTFPLERPTFLREYLSGMYSAGAYFLSKSCVEIPVAFVQTGVSVAILYNMMGLNGPFLEIWLAVFLLASAIASTAVMAGCFAPNPKTAMEAGPLLFVPQILFAGFFVDLSEVPAFLRWVQYLCSLKYAMNLLFIAEFSDHPGGEEVLISNDVEEDLKWAYILLLLALLIVFRLVGLVALTRKAVTVY